MEGGRREGRRRRRGREEGREGGREGGREEGGGGGGGGREGGRGEMMSILFFKNAVYRYEERRNIFRLHLFLFSPACLQGVC